MSPTDPAPDRPQPPGRARAASGVVQSTTEALREMVLACEPDSYLGSPSDLAKRLNVGVVTVEKAARILAHEGLLDVRKGPGGGYYGHRPDEAALERAVAAYLRVHGSTVAEVLEAMSMIEVELITVATRRAHPPLQEALSRLISSVEAADTVAARLEIEGELRSLLLDMADKPLLRLLGSVTAAMQMTQSPPPLFGGERGVAAWKDGRLRILAAMIQQDEELAHFEAMRYRRDLLRRLEAAIVHRRAPQT